MRVLGVELSFGVGFSQNSDVSMSVGFLSLLSLADLTLGCFDWFLEDFIVCDDVTGPDAKDVVNEVVAEPDCDDVVCDDVAGPEVDAAVVVVAATDAFVVAVVFADVADGDAPELWGSVCWRRLRA